MTVATLVVVCGPPCSGKSTLAAELAALTGWPHLSMDSVRERILPDAAHSRADRQAAYRAMALAAELLLRQGAGILLDAPYGHRQDREELAEVIRKTGARLRLVQCRVTPDTALAWFQVREQGPRLDLTAARVAAMTVSYPFAAEGLIIDTAKGETFPEMARALAPLLTEGPSDNPHSWAAAAAE